MLYSKKLWSQNSVAIIVLSSFSLGIKVKATKPLRFRVTIHFSAHTLNFRKKDLAQRKHRHTETALTSFWVPNSPQRWSVFSWSILPLIHKGVLRKADNILVWAINTVDYRHGFFSTKYNYGLLFTNLPISQKLVVLSSGMDVNSGP